jgi:hypothetical protein
MTAVPEIKPPIDQEMVKQVLHRNWLESLESNLDAQK